MIDRFEGEYAFLSNFYPSPIKAVGMTFPTVEHAFQAIKTKDINERRMIAALPTPGQAKRAGRKVHMRSDWNDLRRRVMWSLLKRKFIDPTLRARLLQTGDQELIEGNNWGDTYWGVCNGVGENHLGKLLMKVRDYYRNLQIKVIEGNILDVTKGVIVHQVNNCHVMGSGLAKQIREKYPRHYTDYMAAPMICGTNVNTYINKDLSIVGLIAQNGYGRDGKRYTCYDSLRICLQTVAKDYEGRDIYIPYGIGCGLGGGDWDTVYSIIKECAPGCTLVKYSK